MEALAMLYLLQYLELIYDLNYKFLIIPFV